MTNNKPIHEIRHNGVKVAIWKNDSAKGAFYNASFSRSYRSADGNWHDAHTYGLRDLFALIHCAVEAQAWIFSQGRRDNANAEEAA